MRVVYYTQPAFLDPALQLAREMSRRTEFHLLLELSPWSWQSSSFDVSPRALPSGIHAAEPILEESFPAGVRAYWKDAASFSLVVHNSRKSFHPGAWAVSHDVVRLVRRLQPDVVHFDNRSRRMVLALPQLAPTPIVLGVHDPERHSGEGSWRGEIWRRLTFRRAKRFILHNRTLKPLFCRRYRIAPARVDVVYLGVYELARQWIAQPCQQEGRTVLFFGRLSLYKGLDVLYRAAVRVAERVHGVHFVVAGRPVPGYRPPSPPVLVNGGRIDLFSHYISNAGVAELFERATVVACPYLDATQSGVVLTAYAFARAVVATRTGGLPEYVRQDETGLLVPPGDSEALAAALVTLLSDPGMRGRFERGIRALTGRELGWSAAAQQTLDVYRQAVAT